MTKDLVETLERKIGGRLSKKAKNEIKNLEDDFLTEYWQYVPRSVQWSNGEWNVECQTKQASIVATKLTALTKSNGLPIVGLDRIYVLEAERYLEVTRQTDPKTGKIRLAERPGCLALEEQMANLRDEYRQIALADVGAFEGKTVLTLCAMLADNGIDVTNVYLGFMNKELLTAEKVRSISVVPKVSVLETMRLYEWIELRDLFGIDGRCVGTKNGRKAFMPYWENLKWASVPEKNIPSTATLCKEYNKKLLSVLERDSFDTSKIGLVVKWGAT